MSENYMQGFEEQVGVWRSGVSTGAFWARRMYVKLSECHVLRSRAVCRSLLFSLSHFQGLNSAHQAVVATELTSWSPGKVVRIFVLFLVTWKDLWYIRKQIIHRNPSTNKGALINLLQVSLIKLKVQWLLVPTWLNLRAQPGLLSSDF